MISIGSLKKFCKEDPSMIENYDKAITDNTQIWHCHHRDEIRTLPSGMKVYRSKQELIENGRYYNCPANELIFLTKSEHSTLHNTNRTLSEEAKIKIGKSSKGNTYTRGKTYSEFGRKFKEHYGIAAYDNSTLYNREYWWYRSHNHKCRWELS